MNPASKNARRQIIANTLGFGVINYAEAGRDARNATLLTIFIIVFMKWNQVFVFMCKSSQNVTSHLKIFCDINSLFQVSKFIIVS